MNKNHALCSCFLSIVFVWIALAGFSQVAPEFCDLPRKKNMARNFGPQRKRPVFSGEFTVDLLPISFPDCEHPKSEDVLGALSQIRGSTVTEYYKEYSQGITWPKLRVKPKVYIAPQPLGYYCRFDTHANPIGWQNDSEGGNRAADLRKAALSWASRLRGSVRKAQITCYVYCTQLNRGTDGVETYLRKAYPKKPELEKWGYPDPILKYNPPIPWRDPLWPNSLPQVIYPSDGGALVHELGHVLGAPDFYHASEKYDGLPGTPCLPWDYGPTGPAYCRAIYQAFVPISCYPTITKPGTYTLHPRSANPCKGKNLGCFIPSSHPYYLFYLEFVQNEKPPIGHPGQEGLLIHLINVTMGSPMMGPPDLCYTYRPDDPYFRALNGSQESAYFTEGSEFTTNSNPKAVLPNLLPAGVEIKGIKISEGEMSFDLSLPQVTLSGRERAASILPRISLTRIDEVTMTSFRAHAEVLYRGEPHKTEYGFCYGKAKHPTISGTHFPLYHRDRYDARILDLTPGMTYYVRAYIKSPAGITYSQEEKWVRMKKDQTKLKAIPPLLTDRIINNFYYERWYFQVHDQVRDTANPILTLMSLAAYYHSVPADRSRGRKLNPARIHTFPSESRPASRMVEVEALHQQMAKLSSAAGLRQKEFGNEKKWVRQCAQALNIKDPKNCFFFVDSTSIKQYEAKIKDWLISSQPVLLVRENKLIAEETEVYYPLDIAIIDGLSEEGAYHVVFPCGEDRGMERPTGYYTLNSLFDWVEKSCLLFYRPGKKKTGMSSLRRF